MSSTVAGLPSAPDLGGPSSLPRRGGVEVDRVLGLGEAAVHIEPPVAGEVALLEDGAVGAEEAVLGQSAAAVIAADVEDLALGLGVSVVASLHLAVAGEGGVGNLGEDGVVVSGHPGNVLLEAPRPGLRVTVVPLQVPGGWTVLARHTAHHGGQRCADKVGNFY